MSAPADTVKGISDWTGDLIDQITDPDSDLFAKLNPLFKAAEEATLENSGKTQQELMEYLFMGEPIDQSFRMVVDEGIRSLGELVDDSDDEVMNEAGREQVERSAKLGPLVYESFVNHVIPMWNWYLQVIFDHGPQLSDYVSEEDRDSFHEYADSFKPEITPELASLLESLDDEDFDIQDLIDQVFGNIELTEDDE